MFKLNFGVITQLPKKENAVQIQQYRPICLLNVSFKIFTKVATNRITEIAHKVIRPTQTAFMPGRHILEGVVVLHETIHEIHRKKMEPFRELLLIGSLPVVLLSILSSLDSYVKIFIGDWPYVRLNYELIFPIFGAISIDEEPYLELYDFFKKNAIQVDWVWLYNHSGIHSLRTGFLHLHMEQVFFSEFI